MTVDNEPSGAVFVDDRTHRLYLWRIWNKQEPWVMFIGLNPSTADERQVGGFSGYGAEHLRAVNSVLRENDRKEDKDENS